MSPKSTKADRSLAYLQAHRDSNYTNLPAAHRQAKQQVMAGLREQDPTVHQRALVGSNLHFARPLTGAEREYQRDWQHREGLEPKDVHQRRKELDGEPAGAGARARRAPRGRRPSYRQVRRGARAVTRASPEPVRDTAQLAWNLFAGGIFLSILYLVLTRSQGPIAGIHLLMAGFRRVLLPTQDILFTPAPVQGLGRATTATPALTASTLASIYASVNSAPVPAPPNIASTPNVNLRGPLPNASNLVPSLGAP